MRVRCQRCLLKLLQLLQAPLLLHLHELLLLVALVHALVRHGEQIVEVVGGRVWICRLLHALVLHLLHLLHDTLLGHSLPTVHQQRPKTLLSRVNLFHIGYLNLFTLFLIPFLY